MSVQAEDKWILLLKNELPLHRKNKKNPENNLGTVHWCIIRNNNLNLYMLMGDELLI